MRIVVTGATGFIGTQLIKELVHHDYQPVAVGRNKSKLDAFHENYGIPTYCIDIKSSEGSWYPALRKPDVLIHLAWGSLDDFNSLSHIEVELPAHCSFLKRIIADGVKKIVVAGTCFEYGLQEGKLSEDRNTAPLTPYGIAKDVLHRYLIILQQRENFSLVWLRYFYMYGEGQSKKALFSQLDSALSRGDSVFNMSGGDQLRDYLPVKEVARLTSILATQAQESCIFNICSGQPISIRNLVERRIEELGGGIKLNLGYYPYPEYEPMAFWGDRNKLDQFLLHDKNL